MRVMNPQWFSSMPILGISWISIIASILLGLWTVLLAACSLAKRAAKVSPLTAILGNAGQTVTFRGVTLVPPCSLKAFIDVIADISELCELKKLLEMALDKNKWVIHYGI